ncbi:MAG: Asp-tRNA(Asn)/Glu-tRNA(Gln) amidotransferase subunit GatA [Verrucomicrobiota bacterium]|nr:Asp-tRNA(Asn)/Glu-tRNA(Gln) amidotransferase subunit GatA [Verrucomicrobiota bacterium]
MSDTFQTQSATELSRQLQSGALTALDLTRAALARISAVDDRVKAYLSVNTEDALAQARASDARRAEGKCLGPLDGLPISLKDVIAVRDQPLTCGSRILEKFISPYDSTVTEKLKASGAVLLGRLNMDEFAMGSSTENSAYQVTRNPYDLERVAGGSSGGSAAALAAGMVPLTLGSDTGGSIRQPAAFCGVVGMKPTYGLVSRYGLAAYASSLDQIGPLARSVEDVALLLQAIVGPDDRDSTSVHREVPQFKDALSDTTPRTLGVPKEYFGEGLDPEIRASVEQAIAFYKAQGHKIVEISLPLTDLAIPVYYIIATAEASSNLARYDGVRYTSRSARATNSIDLYSTSRGEFFGAEVKRRIILGTYVLSSGYYDAYYLRAQKVRTLLRNDFLRAFQQVDAILTPTTPTPSFKVGDKANDPLAMYLADIYTISVNLAGLPGISLPCGMSSNGLPIGLQLIGKPFGESTLLSLAQSFEQVHGFKDAIAKL